MMKPFAADRADTGDTAAADPRETAATLAQKLQQLCEALPELPETGRRAADHQATRILLSIEDLAERVRSLAALVETQSSQDWDLVDHTAAQMLLRDLAIIARDLRAVAVTVADDLTIAEGHMGGLNGTLRELERRIASETNLSPAQPSPGALPITPDEP